MIEVGIYIYIHIHIHLSCTLREILIFHDSGVEVSCDLTHVPLCLHLHLLEFGRNA